MQVYFIDESGISNESHFFIFGALGVSEGILESLEKGIASIKQENRIPPNVEVKWNLNDLNKQLLENSLPILDFGVHKKIKSKIIELIASFDPKDLFILWCLSPLKFFNDDPWRSYHYAMNILFKKIDEQLSRSNSRGILLLDEITRTNKNKSEIRILVENVIHTYKSERKSTSISLIIPEVNTKICFGHQLNDLIIGALNNYLSYVISDDRGPSSGVVGALKSLLKFIPVTPFMAEGKIPVYGAGVHIYPKSIKRDDLRELMKKTFSKLDKDFSFC